MKNASVGLELGALSTMVALPRSGFASQSYLAELWPFSGLKTKHCHILVVSTSILPIYLAVSIVFLFIPIY